MHNPLQQSGRQPSAANCQNNEYDADAADVQHEEDQPLLMSQPANNHVFELGHRSDSSGTSPSVSPIHENDPKTVRIVNDGETPGSGLTRKFPPPLASVPSVSSTTYLLNDDAQDGPNNRRGKRTSSWLSQPFGCIVVRNICCPASEIWRSRTFHQYFILIFTFVCYASYHMSRKPVSIVETILHTNCSMYNDSRPADVPANDTTWCDWKPFDRDVYELYFAGLDYAFQFAYAIAMFFSGHLAERMNLRLFLASGMVLSGVATAFFGLGQIFKIHTLPYFIVIQVIAGVFQSSGWPAVVTLVGNWFGNARKGFIFGVWNSHTNIGNILGNSFAGLFVSEGTAYKPWAWSFIVPGAIIAAFGGLVFLFVIPRAFEFFRHARKSECACILSENFRLVRMHLCRHADPRDIGIRDDEDVADSIDAGDAADKTVTPPGSPPQQLKLPPQSYVTPPQAQHHRRASSHEHPPNFISTYGTETHLAIFASASEDQLPHRRNHNVARRSMGNAVTMPQLPMDSTDRGGSAIMAANDSDVESDNRSISTQPPNTPANTPSSGHAAVSFVDALRIPGVIEFSLCLFFAKCVSYTFLYWLPHFIKLKHPSLSAGNLSSIFDVGGIAGGIAAGLLSDVSRMPACVSGAFLLLSMPSLYLLDVLLEMQVLPGQFWLIVMLGVAGAAVTGPYALITTAVSTELGTHPCLKGNSRAVATVTAIIDGTGSLGAAIGPALVGVLTKACGLSCVFQSLMVAQFLGMLFLVRLVFHEVRRVVRSRWRRGGADGSTTTPIQPLSSSSSLRSSGRVNGAINNNSSHIAND